MLEGERRQSGRYRAAGIESRCCPYRMVRNGLKEVKEWMSHTDIKGKEGPDERNSRCQGPALGGCLHSSRSNQETYVVGVG